MEGLCVAGGWGVDRSLRGLAMIDKNENGNGKGSGKAYTIFTGGLCFYLALVQGVHSFGCCCLMNWSALEDVA